MSLFTNTVSPRLNPEGFPLTKKQRVPWAMRTPERLTALTLKTVYWESVVNSSLRNTK